MTSLAIAGITPLTTIDYPDCLSAVVFCQGCPYSCRYCHNPDLIARNTPPAHTWQEVEAFLQTRQGLLDGVVFSGGEPTLQSGLPEAIDRVKALGFKVALHTAGVFPARLDAVLPAVDWVGMDVKAPFNRYEDVTGVAKSGEKARASVDLILESCTPVSFRTTIHPALLSEDDIRELGHTLAGLGAKTYTLQKFRTEGCRDSTLTCIPLDGYPSTALCQELADCFEAFAVT